MKRTIKRIIVCLFIGYCAFSIYTAYFLVSKRGSKNELKSPRFKYIHPNEQVNMVKPTAIEVASQELNDKQIIIEIWGKASIGNFLWEHIFDGDLEDKDGGLWQYGSQTFGKYTIRFRTGPGVIQTTIPLETENLVLVLNGRSIKKIEFAKSWLEYLPSYEKLRNVALVLLGNENCNNEWIEQYLSSKDAHVKALFIVYDSPEIDNKIIYQWPLGVATYRDFPKAELNLADLESPRPYICNFLGSLYKNSSRSSLLKIVYQYDLQQYCYIKTRSHWIPLETDSSMSKYVNVLSQSDLTLSPVGINTECYRIYEAMSLGSIPVVEDVMTPGRCGKSKASEIAPLALLKKMGAPIIYVKDWSELPGIISKERMMTLQQKSNRRKLMLHWYEGFKKDLQEIFMKVIVENFDF